MALPKKVRISGHEFEVRETEKANELGGSGNMGHWQESDMLISVKAGMGDTMKEETLFHEMMEIIFYSILEQDKIPHSVIQSLSSILYQSLTDSGLLSFPKNNDAIIKDSGV